MLVMDECKSSYSCHHLKKDLISSGASNFSREFELAQQKPKPPKEISATRDIRTIKRKEGYFLVAIFAAVTFLNLGLSFSAKRLPLNLEMVVVCAFLQH